MKHRNFCAAFSVCCAIIVAMFTSRQPQLNDYPARCERKEPMRIRARPPPGLTLPKDEYRLISRKISELVGGSMNSSLCLHLLRAYGLQATFDHSELQSSRDVLSLFFDATRGEKYFGAAVLVQTRFGMRYDLGDSNSRESRRAKESHRDQCLAAFAEHGLSLASEIVIDGMTFTLSDVLRDSVANFNLKQDEIAWTALAYGLYLSPQSSWTNKFGEVFTFDALASELLSRPFRRSSCGGLHLLFALTILLHVHDDSPLLLSEDVHLAVRNRVQASLNEAVRTQHADGRWSMNWNMEWPGPQVDNQIDPSLSDLLVTSHVAEWLLYLPASFDAPPECAFSATMWLLGKVRDASSREVREHYCPYLHAICVLNAFAREDPHEHPSAGRDSAPAEAIGP
jgi:hypothetical protein